MAENVQETLRRQRAERNAIEAKRRVNILIIIIIKERFLVAAELETISDANYE
jgi:hypothetical protein